MSFWHTVGHMLGHAASDVGNFAYNTTGLHNDVTGVNKMLNGNIWGGLGNLGLGLTENALTFIPGFTEGRAALAAGELGARDLGMLGAKTALGAGGGLKTAVPLGAIQAGQQGYNAFQQARQNPTSSSIPASYGAQAQNPNLMNPTQAQNFYDNSWNQFVNQYQAAQAQQPYLTGQQIADLATQRQQANQDYANLLANLKMQGSQAQQQYNEQATQLGQQAAGGITNFQSAMAAPGMVQGAATEGVGQDAIAQNAALQKAQALRALNSQLSQNASQAALGKQNLASTLKQLQLNSGALAAGNVVNNLTGGNK